MKCFWCEKEIGDERYIVVEHDSRKHYVCENCILDNEKEKIVEFLKKHPNWIEITDKRKSK